MGAAADGEPHPIALGSEHSGLRADLVHVSALLGAELGEQVDDLSPGGVALVAHGERDGRGEAWLGFLIEPLRAAIAEGCVAWHAVDVRYAT